MLAHICPTGKNPRGMIYLQELVAQALGTYVHNMELCSNPSQLSDCPWEDQQNGFFMTLERPLTQHLGTFWEHLAVFVMRLQNNNKQQILVGPPRVVRFRGQSPIPVRQVDQFARVVRADPKLSHGFNALGYSQGNTASRRKEHKGSQRASFCLYSLVRMDVGSRMFKILDIIHEA